MRKKIACMHYAYVIQFSDGPETVVLEVKYRGLMGLIQVENKDFLYFLPTFWHI